MLFGGTRYQCTDLTNSTTCQEIQVKNMLTYNKAAFILYRFTFGGELARDVRTYIKNAYFFYKVQFLYITYKLIIYMLSINI